MTSPRARLRAILEGNRAAIAPGCYDALGARLIEQAGFPLAYLSGFAVAASYGVPDVGLVTATEMVERARQMANAVDIPVVVDADAGYGGLANVAATIRAHELSGVAGLHIEDQVTPKKCGAMAGKELVPIQEMQARIATACEARRDPELLIIGRTDAMLVSNLDDAILRANAYRKAGADASIVMSLRTEEQMRRVCDEVEGPVIILMAETIRPTLPLSVVEEMGCRLVIYPITQLLAGVKASRDALAALQREGHTESQLGRMATFAEVNELVGLPEIEALERRHAPASSGADS